MRTKKELIETLADRIQMPKKDTEDFVDTLADILRESLAQGGEAILPGLGKFTVKDRPAREGRNPATGEKIQIAASRKLSFSASKTLKEALKG